MVTWGTGILNNYHMSLFWWLNLVRGSWGYIGGNGKENGNYCNGLYRCYKVYMFLPHMSCSLNSFKGLYRGLYRGLYSGSIGIMEKKMEATI